MVYSLCSELPCLPDLPPTRFTNHSICLVFGGKGRGKGEGKEDVSEVVPVWIICISHDLLMNLACETEATPAPPSRHRSDCLFSFLYVYAVSQLKPQLLFVHNPAEVHIFKASVTSTEQSKIQKYMQLTFNYCEEETEDSIYHNLWVFQHSMMKLQ